VLGMNKGRAPYIGRMDDQRQHIGMKEGWLRKKG